MINVHKCSYLCKLSERLPSKMNKTYKYFLFLPTSSHNLWLKFGSFRPSMYCFRVLLPCFGEIYYDLAQPRNLKVVLQFFVDMQNIHEIVFPNFVKLSNG